MSNGTPVGSRVVTQNPDHPKRIDCQFECSFSEKHKETILKQIKAEFNGDSMICRWRSNSALCIVISDRTLSMEPATCLGVMQFLSNMQLPSGNTWDPSRFLKYHSQRARA